MMPRTPQSRKGIHHNEGGSPKEDDDQFQVYKCGECCQRFLEWRSKDEVQQRIINDKEYKEFCGTRTYPVLEIPFTCETCKEKVPESVIHQERLHSEESNNIPSSSENRILWSYWPLILAILFVGISALALKSGEEEALPETPFDVKMIPKSMRETLLEQAIDKLEETYTKQEERVWYTLLAGIKSVRKENPNQPSVFLMLYDSVSAGYTARCLAQDVIKAASKFLIGKQQEPLVYSGSSLETSELLEDPGKLLTKLNDTVRERGSLVITELQNVPPKVAKSFHFICDKYSPLVETAVLFFTLNVDSVGPRIQKDAEARLNQLWARDMEDNFLNPLITRMTPNILKIKSDYYSC